MRLHTILNFTLIIFTYFFKICLSNLNVNPQVFSFHTQETLSLQFQREISKIETNADLTNQKFTDLINYSDPLLPDSFLNLTSINLGLAHLDTSSVMSSCLDNEIILNGGKESGQFWFESKYKILIKETIFMGDCLFKISVDEMQLRKSFEFQNNTPFIRGSILLGFNIKEYTTTEKETTTAYKNILESGLKKYIQKESPGAAIISSILLKKMNEFYNSNYFNFQIFNITTNFPEENFKLDFNFISLPQTIREGGKCGILFQRSGKIEGSAPHDPVNFTKFDFNNYSSQILISGNIFTDMIKNITNKYKFRGKINQITSEFLNLPFRLNVNYFSQILPSILNSYITSNVIEVHWSIYDILLTYKQGSITGKAIIDSTVFANPDTINTKQIYSFDADLSFQVEIDTIERSFNLKVKNVFLNTIRVRENYGYTNIGVLKRWVILTIKSSLQTNPYNLFSKFIDLSYFFDSELEHRILENGILIY